jgi:excisionase family DNA binding protein
VTPRALALQRAQLWLVERLDKLEPQIIDGDADTRREYRDTAVALAQLVAAAERRAEFLTTAELAERLNVSTRTIRRRKKAGTLEPALQLGQRVVRWRGGAA